MDLTEEIYKLMSFMSDDEKYGLTSQIKRCSVSIASNIAEGAGRNSKKEFRNFLSIANGSTTELETQLLLVMRLNLITEEKLVLPLKLTDEKKMNYSLQRSLES
ncbi:four helix bundle protein [Cellulophaga sp. E6(2014)]|uniref:four helix bundle protein n=1 Tax=Cellulophaga sp. E6(2014) TaxID=1495334 RepID=UPI000B1F2DFF|nr:four helix bundle protein [Cellulophaga sp. E6(2014)]